MKPLPLWARTLLRRLRWPAFAVALYLLADQLFCALAGDHGLFFAETSARSLAVLAFGVVLLGLRLTIYFAIPTIVSYKLVSFALERWRDESANEEPR